MDSPVGARDDAVVRGARAAAGRLAREFGASLPADVEVALMVPQDERGARYLDPVAVAALIVSVAQLAWTLYTDLRKHTERPAPALVARMVRVQLADRTDLEPAERNRVIDIVVAETLPNDSE